MTSSNDWGPGTVDPNNPDPLHSNKPLADSAKEEGSNVAATAKGEAQQVMGEAKDKVSDLFADAKSQVGDQSRTQMRSMADKLKELSDELDRMVSSSDAQGTAAQLARALSEKTRSLGSRLSDREPNDLVNDVRHFARQRPGTFLLGAAAAGVLAGRLTRGAKDSSTGSDRSMADQSMARPTTTHTTAQPAHADWQSVDPLETDPLPPSTPGGVR